MRLEIGDANTVAVHKQKRFTRSEDFVIEFDAIVNEGLADGGVRTILHDTLGRRLGGCMGWGLLLDLCVDVHERRSVPRTAEITLHSTTHLPCDSSTRIATSAFWPLSAICGD